MSRKREGWKRLKPTRHEREKHSNPPPGEGGSKPSHEEEKKHFVKRKLKRGDAPQEGGHSQASISEQENAEHEGGHSQAGNGTTRNRLLAPDGGHNQASKSRQHHYGRHGRYNDDL